MRISNASKKNWSNPAFRSKLHNEEHKKNISKALKGNPKVSAARKKLWQDPEYKKHVSKKIAIALTGKKLTLGHVENARKGLKKKWLDPEFRKQQSKSRKGRKVWNKGIRNCFSAETLEKMSDSTKGSKHPNFGKPLSKQTKKKISKALKGNTCGARGSKHPKYNHNIYHFIHESGLELHCTTYELRKKFNLNQGNVSALACGRRHMHKGWKIITG